MEEVHKISEMNTKYTIILKVGNKNQNYKTSKKKDTTKQMQNLNYFGIKYLKWMQTKALTIGQLRVPQSLTKAFMKYNIFT